MASVGTQFIAPAGHKSLNAECVYVYLGRFDREAQVLLCTFEPRRVSLEYLPSAEFEQAAIDGKLIPRDLQAQYPDWLLPAAARSADHSDSFSLNEYKKRQKKSVKKRYKRIKKLLRKQKEIIESIDPLRDLGRHAREIGAHENRLACDFFLVVAYGGSMWALLSKNFAKGTYERTDKPGQKKRGPKHKARGSDYGWDADGTMRELMYSGYDKFSGPGVHMTTIWRKTLTKQFGCKRRKVNDRWEYYHPKSEPFPTIDQFRNAIKKHYGVDRVRCDKLGEQKTRTEKRPSKGSFAASVANIHEQVYADGYFLPEIPKGERDQNHMRKMCVVRVRDVASGPISGIGFSIGGETADAYRMALFCMSIKKSEFGRLMGVAIDDEEWPIVGLPKWFSIDRGPGSATDLLREMATEIPFTEIAPSYAGQSKAVIESTNPRHVECSGPPAYFESDLTYTQLAQREILRSVRDNMRFNVTDRLTPAMKKEGVDGNPLAIYRYLNARHRNDSKSILFEDSVRNFLKPIPVTVTRKGLVCHKQLYDSDELRETEILDRAVASGNYDIPGYAISLCVRQIWIDVRGTLIECQAQLSLRDDDLQLFISLDELIKREEMQRRAERLAEESRLALDDEFEERFKEQTGKEWDAGRRELGRPKTNSPDSRTESADTKKVGAGGG